MKWPWVSREEYESMQLRLQGHADAADAERRAAIKARINAELQYRLVSRELADRERKDVARATLGIEAPVEFTTTKETSPCPAP